MEDNENPDFDYVSIFEPIFIMMKKSLQKKVDDYIKEMNDKRDAHLKKIKSVNPMLVKPVEQ
jgi:hypothetical protein